MTAFDAEIEHPFPAILNNFVLDFETRFAARSTTTVTAPSFLIGHYLITAQAELITGSAAYTLGPITGVLVVRHCIQASQTNLNTLVTIGATHGRCPFLFTSFAFFTITHDGYTTGV